MRKRVAVDGYIVEHCDGVMGLGRGYRPGEERTLYVSPREVTIFPTRSAARWAINRTIQERNKFLDSLTNAMPGYRDRDNFNKKHKFSIIRASFKR